VVAISPDPPEVSAEFRKVVGPGVVLLSDPDGRVPSLCDNLAHCQVLLDRDGVVRWGALDENWRSIDLDSVLQAAYRLR
jgi:peroxiredoxin